MSRMSPERGNARRSFQESNEGMTFLQLREKFPRLLCECGHPIGLHSLNIEFHTCLAAGCWCRGFTAEEVLAINHARMANAEVERYEHP
ncbi:hypothetical protein DYQ86_22615 [Acidobacteria bacterium AB60]|nr:hypothetical protein DYQ86_22615 [Acidobacteria bacterium AB60]